MSSPAHRLIQQPLANLLTLASGARARAAVAAIMLTLVPREGSAAISLAQWDVGTDVHTTELRSQFNSYLCCGDSLDIATPEGIPFSFDQVAQSGAPGSEFFHSYDTSYDFSESVLAIDMTHVRGRRSRISSYGFIYFSVDLDSNYALEGMYDHPDGQIEVRLSDLSGGGVLFQNGLGGPYAGSVLTLGEPGSVLLGSLTGILQKDHVFQLMYYMGMGSNEANDGGASAAGFVRLSVVPEPGLASLILLGLGAVALRNRNGLGRR